MDNEGMGPGSVVRLRNFRHYTGEPLGIQSLDFTAPKDKVFLVLLLGAEPKDDPSATQANAEAYLKRLGWFVRQEVAGLAHSETPWTVEPHDGGWDIYPPSRLALPEPGPDAIATVYNKDDADFIVQACNAAGLGDATGLKAVADLAGRLYRAIKSPENDGIGHVTLAFTENDGMRGAVIVLAPDRGNEEILAAVDAIYDKQDQAARPGSHPEGG